MKPIHCLCLIAVAFAPAGGPLAATVVAPAHAAQVGSAAEPSPELADLRQRGIETHDRASGGRGGAAKDAVDLLERYLERFPDDAEARAYLGSAYALKGRDAASVVNKTRYANRGLRHLDRALEEAPRMFAVRLIRANVNSQLPKMFGRGEAALRDMQALDEIYREQPSSRMAREMVAIYEALRRRAPDAGPWAERLERARELSREDRQQ